MSQILYGKFCSFNSGNSDFIFEQFEKVAGGEGSKATERSSFRWRRQFEENTANDDNKDDE